MIDTSSKRPHVPSSDFKVPDLPSKHLPDNKKSLEAMFDSMQIKVVGRENEDQRSQGSLNEESDDDDDQFDMNKSFMEDPSKISQKHQKFTELETRAREDMDFPDEVDTPLDEEARKRFIQYRGIKSIKNCNWDPFENLPADYSKIWRFQNFTQAQKDSVQ